MSPDKIAIEKLWEKHSYPKKNPIHYRLMDQESFKIALSEAEGERWIEQALREEWWFKHGCAGGQYGDDGEMQCCMIDFKRTPIHELREIVEALRLRRRFPAPPKEKP